MMSVKTVHLRLAVMYVMMSHRLGVITVKPGRKAQNQIQQGSCGVDRCRDISRTSGTQFRSLGHVSMFPGFVMYPCLLL
jgi:hypothetical protein